MDTMVFPTSKKRFDICPRMLFGNEVTFNCLTTDAFCPLISRAYYYSSVYVRTSYSKVTQQVVES
jgi:hypothetical protein